MLPEMNIHTIEWSAVKTDREDGRLEVLDLNFDHICYFEIEIKTELDKFDDKSLNCMIIDMVLLNGVNVHELELSDEALTLIYAYAEQELIKLNNND